MWQHITKEPVRAPQPIDVAAGLGEGGAPDTTPLTTKVEYTIIYSVYEARLKLCTLPSLKCIVHNCSDTACTVYIQCKLRDSKAVIVNHDVYIIITIPLQVYKLTAIQNTVSQQPSLWCILLFRTQAGIWRKLYRYVYSYVLCVMYYFL